MAALGVKKSVAAGTPLKLNDALIVGAGTLDFVLPYSQYGDFSLLFQAVGTVTGLVCDLQVSLDGGTTFNTLTANLLIAATPFKIQTPVVSGPIYRLNITTPPTSADIWVTRN